jgi:hypothetical protein
VKPLGTMNIPLNNVGQEYKIGCAPMWVLVGGEQLNGEGEEG